MGRLLATLQTALLLSLLAYSTANNIVNAVQCTKCKCYELKCSRLENPDPTCVNKYRDSCDNSEDISESDFCNIQCDCCLETKCYSWDSYPCIMFRTYEFANIVYFILLTVNAFVLIRVLKAMFSKEEEIKTEESEEEEENLKHFKQHTPERFLCPYTGRLAVKTDTNTFAKVPEERLDMVRSFFANIEGKEKYAKKNLYVYIALVVIYVIINIFHIINIFALGNLPLTYVKIVWLQHILLIVFWVAVVLSFKKLDLYSGQIKDVMQSVEQQEKCKITIHSNLSLIEFNFNDNYY